MWRIEDWSAEAPKSLRRVDFSRRRKLFWSVAWPCHNWLIVATTQQYVIVIDRPGASNHAAPAVEFCTVGSIGSTVQKFSDRIPTRILPPNKFCPPKQILWPRKLIRGSKAFYLAASGPFAPICQRLNCLKATKELMCFPVVDFR